MDSSSSDRLRHEVIESLHVEAMLLADEARSYFDIRSRRAGEDHLAPITRIALSCEALRVTTRLMHVIAWLLTRRAVAAGEIDEREAASPARRLGADSGADPELMALLPEQARQIIAASIDLHARATRLEAAMIAATPPFSPALDLMRRLAAAF